MDIVESKFKSTPAQAAVVDLFLRVGVRIEDGRAWCDGIVLGDCAIGRAAGVDRRVVRATIEKIAGDPELLRIFSKLNCTLSMVDMASEIGCSSIVITPTDATLPGILADITEVLFRFNVSVRQAMVDDSGNGAVLQVVAYGRIPPEAIPELRSCRGVSSVLIK